MIVYKCVFWIKVDGGKKKLFSLYKWYPIPTIEWKKPNNSKLLQTLFYVRENGYKIHVVAHRQSDRDQQVHCSGGGLIWKTHCSYTRYLNRAEVVSLHRSIVPSFHRYLIPLLPRSVVSAFFRLFFWFFLPKSNNSFKNEFLSLFTGASPQKGRSPTFAPI